MTELYGYWSPGDIYLCTIPYNTGHEITKDRPAVVVSDAEFNRRNGTVWVVMCSSTDRSLSEDCVPVSGLTQKSWALCGQLYSVDKTRLYRLVGQATSEELQNIGAAISRHLPSFSSSETKAPGLDLHQELTRSQAERDTYKQLYDNLLSRVVGGGGTEV